MVEGAKHITGHPHGILLHARSSVQDIIRELVWVSETPDRCGAVVPGPTIAGTLLVSAVRRPQKNCGPSDGNSFVRDVESISGMGAEWPGD
jgi:hypothetical protein